MVLENLENSKGSKAPYQRLSSSHLRTFSAETRRLMGTRRCLLPPLPHRSGSSGKNCEDKQCYGFHPFMSIPSQTVLHYPEFLLDRGSGPLPHAITSRPSRHRWCHSLSTLHRCKRQASPTWAPIVQSSASIRRGESCRSFPLLRSSAEAHSPPLFLSGAGPPCLPRWSGALAAKLPHRSHPRHRTQCCLPPSLGELLAAPSAKAPWGTKPCRPTPSV
jgi:hypothetical protein